jgi:hypothetical protein
LGSSTYGLLEELYWTDAARRGADALRNAADPNLGSTHNLYSSMSTAWLQRKPISLRGTIGVPSFDAWNAVGGNRAYSTPSFQAANLNGGTSIYRTASRVMPAQDIVGAGPPPVVVASAIGCGADKNMTNSPTSSTTTTFPTEISHPQQTQLHKQKQVSMTPRTKGRESELLAAIHNTEQHKKHLENELLTLQKISRTPTNRLNMWPLSSSPLNERV